MPNEFFSGLASDLTGGSDKAPEKELAAAPVAADAPIEEAQKNELPAEGNNSEQGGNEAPASSEQTFPVMLDGQEVQVPLSELIAGHQRRSDYTQKTQKLAEERKAAEGEKAEVAKVREQYGTLLTSLESAIKPNLPTPEQEAAALRENRLQDYLQMQQTKAHYQSVQAEQARVQQETDTERQRQRGETEKVERAKLLEALPEWKTDHHGAKRVSEYLQGYGYSDNEIAEVLDHRHIVIAEKARRWDELQKNKPAAEQKVANVPQVGRPGARQESKAGKDAKAADLSKAIASTGSGKALQEWFKVAVN